MEKQKVLLVEVPDVKLTYETTRKEETCSSVRTNYPKQSQLVIAGFLRNLADIEIVDMKIDVPNREEFYKEISYGPRRIKCYRVGASFDGLEDRIKRTDIVGLTSNFTKSAGVVTDFIRYSKLVNPNAKVIIGGSDAIPRYDYYLEKGADIIILGEGEYIGPRVITALKENQSLNRITGIAYVEDGNIKYNPINPSTDKVIMDDVPLPAFDLIGGFESYTEAFEGSLPEKVRTPLGLLETSRGCARACPFCTTPYLRGRYRIMSTSGIEKLLGHYKKNGVETLVIMEDNILSRLTLPAGREKVIELFDLLRKYNFAWEFGNGLELGKLMFNDRVDYELIEKLFYQEIRGEKLVGAYRIFTPLESLHPEPQTIYNKLKPYKQELEIIEAIASTKIIMMTFGIILGSPQEKETRESLKLTEERCLEIKKIVEENGTQAHFTLFLDILLPGTPHYKKYNHQLSYTPEQYPELFNLNIATLGSGEFTPEVLTFLKEEMERRINGKEATEFWNTTGKYYFKK